MPYCPDAKGGGSKDRQITSKIQKRPHQNPHAMHLTLTAERSTALATSERAVSFGAAPATLPILYALNFDVG